jgi:hypothetical protein
MFDKAIIHKIMDSWIIDTADARDASPGRPPFMQEDVEFLVETAFLASLKKEEDRPVTFSLVFLSKKRAARSFADQKRRQLIMTFEQSLPLTVDTLSKIALAFNPRFTSFVVAPPADEGKKRYEIWGAMFFNALPNYFDDVPAGMDGEVFRRPDVFMITSVTPGSLIISRGDTQVGRFVAGKFIKATPSPFYPKAMGNFLFNKIKRDTDSKATDKAYWKVFIHSLDYLLSEISSRSHGGSVLIVPEQKLALYKEHFSAKYAFRENLKIHELILEFLNIDPHSNDAIMQRLDYNRKIAERLQVLAQLAAVDGALIISGTFRIMYFGVTLKAPRWKSKVLEGPDGYNGGNAIFEHHLLGTRHNSMIDFIGKCSDSIGFVISQDGPIRGLVRKNMKTMYCWPDCRVSMFI